MMSIHCVHVAVLFLVSVGLTNTQRLGDICTLQDRTSGVCLDIGDCINRNGHVESASSLEICSSSTFNRIIACCRSTPENIAREKCNEWKREARRQGSECVENIPLSFGGSQAKLGEFPHIVSILIPAPNNGGLLTHICGGMLISKRYVLTAAHCLNDSRVYVRIGGHDLRNSESGITVDSEVTDSIIHPDYSQPRKYHDIALLKLRFEVPFSSRVRPACLPYRKRRILPGSKLVVAGWGVFENGGRPSDILRKTEVSVIDRLTCDANPTISDFISTLEYPAGITDSIICADESQTGACNGDSGGPLMEDTQTSCEVKEVIGIVSQGGHECRSSNIPGTYTSIEYYLDWIVRNIWPNELGTTV